MHTDKSKNSVYVYYTRISDRLSYSSADASELAENLLARGLDELYGIVLSKEERSKGPHGKPYLVNHPKIHYNISHSGRFVLCAISGVPVGIDIQQKRIVDVAKVGKKIFPDEEYRRFLKSETMQEDFFRQWVLRESYLKWTGEGLTKDLRDLKTEGWHQFLHLHRDYMCALWAGKPLEIHIKEVS